MYTTSGIVNNFIYKFVRNIEICNIVFHDQRIYMNAFI